MKPRAGPARTPLEGNTVIKALGVALPLAFGVALMASTAQAAACAGSGVITRISGNNKDVAINRAGRAVANVRVLEVVCVGDVVTAKGATSVTLSIDGVGAIKVDQAKPYTVGPRRGKPSATGNVYRAVSDQVLPDMKRLPWDVRTKGVPEGDPPLRFATATNTPQVISPRGQLLVRLIGNGGPYEVTLLTSAGATVKTVSGATEELVLNGLTLAPGSYKLTAKDNAGATAELAVQVEASVAQPTGEFDDISDPEVVAAVKAMRLAQSDPSKYTLEAQQILASAPSNGMDRERVYQRIETLGQDDAE